MKYNSRRARRRYDEEKYDDMLRRLNITCKHIMCRKSPHTYKSVKVKGEHNHGIRLMQGEICVREWRIGQNIVLCYFEDKTEYPIQTHEIEKLEKWIKIKNLIK